MSMRWLRSMGAAVFPALGRPLVTEAGLDAAGEVFDLALYEREAGRRFHSLDDALVHYASVGSRRGLRPNADFSPDEYRRRNHDIVAAGYEPFAHYLHFGRREGRTTRAAIATPDAPDLRRMLAHQPRGAGPADVVIPIYNSRALALRAIDSVLDASSACEIVVVDDASTDKQLHADLEALAGHGLITLLTNPVNLGFVGSVNRGMSYREDRDVVLLNSDTSVWGDWLERLLAALRSGPRTATATPMSNAATILSYPFSLRDNDMADGDAAAIDTLAARLPPEAVEIPTGIGFCMAISRACIKEIGLFDAANFGRGYGEENDFCLRAAKAGWRNVAATNLFVWHRGGGSFESAERNERLAAALATLERLHPGYGETISRFIAVDPLRAARGALDRARIGADARRKRLVLGEGDDSPDAASTLTLALVADVGRFHGKFTFVSPDLPGVASLPRIDDLIAPEALAAMLAALSISVIRFGKNPRLPSALQETLRTAAKEVRIEVE